MWEGYLFTFEECKLVKPFRKASWQYLAKCRMYTFSDRKSLLLDIHHKNYLQSSKRGHV